MLEIKVIASGSDGNAILLRSEHSKLLIECGINFNTLTRSLWDLGETVTLLDGCLISHCHLDHCKAVKDILKYGVDCYMGIETANQFTIADHHRVVIIDDTMPNHFDIGSWVIVSFEGVHDVSCLGFLIAHGNDRILYLSDSAYCEYKFPGLTHILIGCNYSMDILNENIQDGQSIAAKGRLIHSHASLETIKEMLKANDLSKLKELHLLHLSKKNADPERFKREIAEIVGVPMYVH